MHDTRLEKAIAFLNEKKECGACDFERKEYNVRYCTDCYHNGGKEVDDILGACTLGHATAQAIVDCKKCQRAIDLFELTDSKIIK